MQAEFTGLHHHRFELADDSGVKGPPNIYDVVIVIGLYDSKEVITESKDT